MAKVRPANVLDPAGTTVFFALSRGAPAVTLPGGAELFIDDPPLIGKLEGGGGVVSVLLPDGRRGWTSPLAVLSEVEAARLFTPKRPAPAARIRVPGAATIEARRAALPWWGALLLGVGTLGVGVGFSRAAAIGRARR